MKIKVKTLTGKAVILDVNSSDTVLDLKNLIRDHSGVPPDEQRLHFLGKELEQPIKVSRSEHRISSVIVAALLL